MRFFQPTIDREQKRVRASLYGLGSRSSIFREGLGCTLVIGTTEDALRAEAKGLFTDPRSPAPDVLWPGGERVDLTALPDGIDAKALKGAIDAIFSEPDAKRPRRTRALVVVYQGRIVAERYAEGFDADMPLVGWSMSKTATNALTGLRVADRKLVVTENALMPEWRDSNDPRRAIRLDDLLRMTSGLLFDETNSRDLSDVTQMLFVEGNAAAYAARKPLVHPPGTFWYHSSGSTNIIASVLRQTFPTSASICAIRGIVCSARWACVRPSCNPMPRGRFSVHRPSTRPRETGPGLDFCFSKTAFGTARDCCRRIGLPTRCGQPCPLQTIATARISG